MTPSRIERDVRREASLIGARKSAGDLGFQIAPELLFQKRRLAAAAVRIPGRSDRVPRPGRKHGTEQWAGGAPRLGRRRRAAGGARAPPRRKERGGGGSACGAAGLRRDRVRPVPRAGRRRSPAAMPAAPP